MKLCFAGLFFLCACGGSTSDEVDASGGSSGSGQGGASNGGTSAGGSSAGGSSAGGFAGSPAGGGNSGCGTGGFSASSGDGGGCNPDPNQGSKVEGNVIVYDATLSTKQPFMGKALILMDGTPCGWAVANYDGTSSPAQNFLLQGVAPQASNWMHLNNKTEDVMTTLIAVTTFDDLTLIDEFAFVRGSEVEALYQSAGVTRDPQKGTVLVQVVDVLGTMLTPKADAKVTSDEAEGVAYRDPSGWALGGQTDATGMAALLNTSACGFPGTVVELTVETGAITDTFPAAVETGAVTILRVTNGF